MKTKLRKLLVNLAPLKRRSKFDKWLRRFYSPAWLGNIRRTRPISEHYGYDRGLPIDRYYIENFLVANQEWIHGHVLEIKDNSYTMRFGRNVSQSDVLDINPNNSKATIIADLSTADTVPSDKFDCFILTQTLHLIYDLPSTLTQVYRILRPGGVLLATVPSVSRISNEPGTGEEYWRFTYASCFQLFQNVFGKDSINVRSYGNVLTSVGFLMGMAREEFSKAELDVNDECFPLIITIKALKI